MSGKACKIFTLILTNGRQDSIVALVLSSTFVVLQVKLVSLKSKGTTKQAGKRNAEFHQAHVIYQKRINEPYNSSSYPKWLLCHHRVKPHLHNPWWTPSSKLNVNLHCASNSVWKLLKMSHLNFLILVFSTNFCPIKTDLSGNTIWPQASDFQKLAKIDHFWHL